MSKESAVWGWNYFVILFYQRELIKYISITLQLHIFCVVVNVFSLKLCCFMKVRKTVSCWSLRWAGQIIDLLTLSLVENEGGWTSRQGDALQTRGNWDLAWFEKEMGYHFGKKTYLYKNINNFLSLIRVCNNMKCDVFFTDTVKADVLYLLVSVGDDPCVYPWTVRVCIVQVHKN